MMFKRILVIFFLFIIILTPLPTIAQSETECDTKALSETLAAYSKDISTATYDEIKTIADEMDALLAAYVDDCSPSEGTASTGEVLFTIKATGNINIRSCGETSCDVVSTATDGQVFSVVGEAGDWYEVDLGNSETGFIASWLTTPGPDEVIDVLEGYVDLDINCVIQGVASRSTSGGLDFAISGKARGSVLVDIFRPNTNNPEPVWQQFDKAFIDTNEPYIHQVYRSSFWPVGTYQLSVDRDNTKKNYAFDITQSGELTIHVICE